MKQSIDAAFDDHPTDDEDRPPAWWIVNLFDDCEGCEDLRIELVLELSGTQERVSAHLSAASTRKLRAALTTALQTVGEDQP